MPAKPDHKPAGPGGGQFTYPERPEATVALDTAPRPVETQRDRRGHDFYPPADEMATWPKLYDTDNDGPIGDKPIQPSTFDRRVALMGINASDFVAKPFGGQLATVFRGLRRWLVPSDPETHGKLVYTGKYLVGKEVQPGTWQSQGDKVEDCYWEISDAKGEIIANNFISVSPQSTLTIPASAAGFTVKGCGFRWIGG